MVLTEMTPDRTHAFATGLLCAYLRWKVRRHFHYIRVDGHRGFSSLLHARADEPLILYGNHCSWWDGFLLFLLGRVYGLNMRVMMEERTLRRYPFFRYTGAFGIDLSNQKSRAQSLLHAVRFLKDDNLGPRALLIYPQGRLVSPFEEWPPFKPGLEALLRLCPKATAVPVVHEIVPGKDARADAFMEVGRPFSGKHCPHLDELEKGLKQTHEMLVNKALYGASVDAHFLTKPKECLPMRWLTGKTAAPWILPKRPSASSAAVTWARQSHVRH